MFLVVVIVQDKRRIPDLIHAWQKIGVPGGTILNSAGLYQTAGWLSQLGLGALDRIFDRGEESQRTVLVALEKGEILEGLIAEADRVVGGFQNPNSGLLFVLPIVSAQGLVKLKPRNVPEELPPPLIPEWQVRRNTLIGNIPEFMLLKPTIVKEDMPLDDVACEMMKYPNNHVVCVVNHEERLVGVLDLSALADDLFFHIFPEEFLTELTDLDHVMDFAKKSRMRTAADAMYKRVWIRESDTVKEAFKRMHDNKLSGLPVVDNGYHITGYINLLSLLSHCVEEKKKREEDSETGSEDA